MPVWGKAVNDDNPIHTDIEIAKEMGFEDTPVHGTRIAASAEQFALDEINAMNSLGSENLIYTGQTIKLRKPLYPGVQAEWTSEFGSIEDEGNKLELKVFLNAGDEKIASGVATVDLAREKFRLGKIEKIVKTTVIPKDADKIHDYYECLDCVSEKGLDMMYVAATIPSTLLTLLPKDDGKPKGGYSTIYLQFYNQPKAGEIKTIVGLASPPSMKRGTYFYTFEALCSQDDVPILSGKVKAYLKKKLNFKLAD